MDKWTDRQINGQIDGQKHRQIETNMDRNKHGQKPKWIEIQMDRNIDGQK